MSNNNNNADPWAYNLSTPNTPRPVTVGPSTALPTTEESHEWYVPHPPRARLHSF